jgi:hypothetical protein
MVQQLLTAVAATGAGSAVHTGGEPAAKGEDTGIVQAVITGTATVVLEGSLDNTNWVTITSFTASGGSGVLLWPYLRGNVTSRTSGNVTLMLSW